MGKLQRDLALVGIKGKAKNGDHIGPRCNWDYLWAPRRCLKRASFLANSAWGSLAGMPSSTLGSGILFRATLFAFLTKLFTSQKSPALYFARVNHFIIHHFLSGEEMEQKLESDR